MNKFLKSLLSRKLWLAVAGFITFVANKQYPEALGVVVSYHAANTADKYLT